MTASSNSVADKAARLATWADETERLCDRATPGPWTSFCDKRLSPNMAHPGMSSRVLVDRPNYDDSFVIRGGNPLGISCGNVVCSADSYSGESGSPDDIHNAAFIAAARPLVPALVAYTRSLLAAWTEAEAAAEPPWRAHSYSDAAAHADWQATRDTLRGQVAALHDCVFGEGGDGDL